MPPGELTGADGFRLIAVCPEMDGGLPCPRPASQIVSGDGFSVIDQKSSVIDSFGGNVTDKYLVGAETALKIALKNGAKSAFLKDKSPSCGVRRIYRDGKPVPGIGVTAALLSRHNIKLECIE